MGKFLQALGFQTLADEPEGDYSANVQPPSRSAVEPVNEDRALTLPAFFRGVRIITGMGAQLPLAVYRNGEKIPTPSIVEKPDPWRKRRSFFKRTLTCLVLDGNAFWLKSFDSNGTVVALEVLNPRSVWIDWTTGVKRYHAWTRGRGQRTYTDREIEHIWGLEVYGHDRGLGVVTACRLSVAGILNVRDFADGWFNSPDVPSGILTTEQKLDRDGAKQYKKAWYGTELDDDDPEKGRIGPRLRILGQGLSYESMMLSPEDAQWLESQKGGVLDVCRMLGLPAEYNLAAVEGTSLTYNNGQMIDTTFLRTTLFPDYLSEIEDAFTEILPRGQVAKFETDEFLRPDEKTQAEIDTAYVGIDVYDADEIRARKGLAPRTSKTEVPA